MLTRLAPGMYLFSSGIAGACPMLRLSFCWGAYYQYIARK